MRADSDPIAHRDSGLQPERTALAWRRLAIILLGVALVTTRLLWPSLQAWALLPTFAIASAATILLAESHRRYLGQLASTTTTPPDGRLAFFAALACTVASLLVLVVVISDR